MKPSHFDIIVGSHYYEVHAYSWRAKSSLDYFSKRFIEYSYRGGNKTPMGLFALKDKDGFIYSFLKTTFDQFINFLEDNRYSKTDYHVTYRESYEAASVDFKIRDGWYDKQNQVRLLEYLDDDSIIKKLATLQTGDGKTYSCIKHNHNKKQRYCIVVRPNLIPEWYTALTSIYDIDSDRILIVQGGKDLKAMLADIVAGDFDYDVVVISNKTLQVWLKAFEQIREQTLDLGYDILLTDFFEAAQIGERVIDEVHLDFNFQVRLDCATHVNRSTSLSATFESDNHFITRMQNLAYPIDTRYKPDAYRKYTKSYSVNYNLKKPEFIRTTERNSNDYSHHAFEASIIKYVPLLKGYLDLVKMITDQYFVPIQREGKKLAVFATSIAMCTYIRNHLKSAYPQYEVERYTSDDPEENLKADIIVTTLGSMGTGKNIVGLVMAILTSSVNSTTANKQTYGRLRQIPGFDTLFFYFVCKDIAKHVEYGNNKSELMGKIALSHTNINTGLRL